MTQLRFLRIWVERSQSERLLFNEWIPNQRALFSPRNTVNGADNVEMLNILLFPLGDDKDNVIYQ